MRTEANNSEKKPCGETLGDVPAFARLAMAGIPYHVTQRGNYRQDVFRTAEDREIYLAYVASAATAYGLELHGWCLMTNHVHWIVLPRNETAMAQTFRRAHSRFASYVNRQHLHSSGHLWQGRYYSCPLDTGHFFKALLYVERNPVRAGLARSASAYPWSSAAARLGQNATPDYLALHLWSDQYNGPEWARMLEGDASDQGASELRSCSRQGKPYGSQLFIERFQERTKRDLRVRPVGRPPLATAD